MRICLVVHGYPPVERTGVENYTEGLAREFAARGHDVHIYTRRTDSQAPDLARRVERRDGTTIHWLITNKTPGNASEALDPPGSAQEFARFLDEVRPEVVHFQHVIKLGIGLLTAAGERGIPILYTTHDFYSICHRFTLLRPDLQNCGARQDPEACARCDQAVELLSTFELGEYQLGVFEDELEPEQYALLQSTLSEDGVAGLAGEGAADPDSDGATKMMRLDLDRARTEAFNCVDLFISPSRHLADVLIEGGFAADRFLVQANGLDTADLSALPAPEWRSGQKLRLGFFGGLSKHKGVQDLLEAFDGLQDIAELVIHGYTTDASHLARLNELAERVGARIAGSYHRADIAGLYSTIDAIVVPSIWSENQPLVIQEAFAARRPVVTANYGALPENVRDGVDGLLYAPWDVESLRATIRRLATEDGLYERLVFGAQRPKDVATQALELEHKYAGLVEARRTKQLEMRANLPASLHGPAERFGRLNALPQSELVRRAIHGLRRLATGVGLSDDTELLAQGLSGRLDARDELEDLERTKIWLRTNESSLNAELEWRRGAMDNLSAEAVWLREKLAPMDACSSGLLEVLEEFEHRLHEQDLDTSWVREASEWIRNDIAAAPQVARALLDGQWRLLSLALTPLASLVETDGEATTDPFGSVQTAVRRIECLANELHESKAAMEQNRADLERANEVRSELDHELTVLSAEADGLRQERAWRATEMAQVQAKLSRGPLRFLLGRTKLGQRILAWSEEGKS